METKEKFKDFVKVHPHLVKFVKSGEMTWQKFYEIYDMYGEKEEVWKEYLPEPSSTEPSTNSTGTTSTLNIASLGEIMNFVKNLDLDSVQNGVNSLQRVLGVLQDFGTNNQPKEEYKPRPLYKHFED